MVFLRSIRSLAFCSIPETSIHDFALQSSDMIDCMDPAIMNFSLCTSHYRMTFGQQLSPEVIYPSMFIHLFFKFLVYV